MSVTPINSNSVPSKFSSTVVSMMACNVVMSWKPCFTDFSVLMVPNRDLAITVTPLLSKVAKASLSPIPNLPITWALDSFSWFSFWVRCVYLMPRPKSLIIHESPLLNICTSFVFVMIFSSSAFAIISRIAWKTSQFSRIFSMFKSNFFSIMTDQWFNYVWLKIERRRCLTLAVSGGPHRTTLRPPPMPAVARPLHCVVGLVCCLPPDRVALTPVC